MTECPSVAAERYIQDEEFANCPSDDDLLGQLDACNQSQFTIGWSDAWESRYALDRGECWWYFDYRVHECPDRGLVIAYIVVEDIFDMSVSTVEKGVIKTSESESILSLIDNYLDKGFEVAMNNELSWTDTEVQDAKKASAIWRESILSALKVDKRVMIV